MSRRMFIKFKCFWITYNNLNISNKYSTQNAKALITKYIAI